MASEDQFRDEWICPVLESFPGVTGGKISQWRRERRPYLSEALVEAGFADITQVANAVHKAFAIDFAPLSPAPDRETVSHVPEKIRRRHNVMPVRVDSKRIDIAMTNPLDEEAIRAISWATDRAVVPLFCPPSRLDEIARQTLTPEAVIFNLLERIPQAGPVEVLGVSREAAAEEEEREVRGPVIQLVNAVIADAVRRRASDIHIEHDDQSSVVRYRIDGLLRKMMVLPRYLGVGPMVARVKIMARLDVSDRLRPQDGRAKIRVGAEEIGLRVSTLPTRVGEKVVIRILNDKTVKASLDALGLSPVLLPRLTDLLQRKQGMFLVTGPTGSGKTTTLYAALNARRSEAVNIVTVEDPVEYRLAGINQVQVNEKQGLNFATVLRSVLRQDPDIVLVGEIRDRETASVAIQAAMTGHLVLSTLHTNDAVGAVARLVDMGVEAFKVSAALLAVSAQRLLRKVCPQCATEAPRELLDPAVRDAMEFAGLPRAHSFAKGCAHCSFSGYVDRFPVTELLTVTPEMREAITNGVPEESLRSEAVRSGALYTMEYDILWHLSRGHTTQEEVLPYLESSRLAEMGVTHSRRSSRGSSDAPDGSQPPRADDRGGIVAVVATGNDELRGAIALRMKADGITVHEAVDGGSALALAAKNQPDILLVDLELPGADGMQVVRAAVSLSLDVASLVLVPSDQAGREAALLLEGPTDILVLPASPDEICARASSTLMLLRGWSDASEVMRPPTPPNEAARLDALHRTKLLDSPAEERFDKITRLAQRLLDVPIAMVTLIDDQRHWSKSSQGLDRLELPRDVSFCAHAINSPDMMVVPDAALDPRFAENPLVTGDSNIRFYAGYPLKGPGGHNIGTLCVIAHEPRHLSSADEQSLRDLGAMAEAEVARR